MTQSSCESVPLPALQLYNLRSSLGSARSFFSFYTGSSSPSYVGPFGCSALCFQCIPLVENRPKDNYYAFDLIRNATPSSASIESISNTLFDNGHSVTIGEMAKLSGLVEVNNLQNSIIYMINTPTPVPLTLGHLVGVKGNRAHATLYFEIIEYPFELESLTTLVGVTSKTTLSVNGVGGVNLNTLLELQVSNIFDPVSLEYPFGLINGNLMQCDFRMDIYNGKATTASNLNYQLTIDLPMTVNIIVPSNYTSDIVVNSLTSTSFGAYTNIIDLWISDPNDSALVNGSRHYQANIDHPINRISFLDQGLNIHDYNDVILPGMDLFKPIQLPFIEPDHTSTLNQFNGYFNQDRNCFEFPFFVMKDKFEGPMDYHIVTASTSNLKYAELYAKFGPSSTINIVSENADLLPPLVVNVVAFPSNVVDYLSITNHTIGWDITIEDANGVIDIVVVVSSQYEPEYLISTLTCENNDRKNCIAKVRFELPATGKQTQDYFFSLALKDDLSNTATSQSAATFFSHEVTCGIDPFFKILNTSIESELRITVEYNTPVLDSIPPYISDLVVDVDSAYPYIFVNFTVCDNESGVRDTNTPTVYLSTLFGSMESTKSRYLSSVSSTFQTVYTVQNQTVYSAAFDRLSSIFTDPILFISIYGLMDNGLNLNGYTSSQLMDAQLQSNDQTIASSQFISHSINSIVIKYTIPDTEYGSLRSIDPESNTLDIYINPEFIDCPGEDLCKPYGTCDKTDVVQPVANITVDDGSALGLITIHQLRELDSNGVVVDSYDLGQKDLWTFKQTIDTNVLTNHYAGKVDGHSPATIDIYISVYNQTTNYEFAGINYTISPSSLKYSFRLTDYQFKSQLNTLQLVMEASIHSTNSSCSSQEIGGNATDVQWMKIKLDDKSIYARFLSRALIDDRVRTVTTSLVEPLPNDDDNTVANHDTSVSLIGINIPYFSWTASLDPDLSIITDYSPRENDINMLCRDTTSKVNYKLIGIIVGAAAVYLSIVAAATIITLRERRQRRDKANRQLKLHTMMANGQEDTLG
eukprot:gene4034-4672_t